MGRITVFKDKRWLESKGQVSVKRCARQLGAKLAELRQALVTRVTRLPREVMQLQVLVPPGTRHLRSKFTVAERPTNLSRGEYCDTEHSESHISAPS